MAFAVDLAELLRRMADDVHQILKGAKPGDIPFISLPRRRSTTALFLALDSRSRAGGASLGGKLGAAIAA